MAHHHATTRTITLTLPRIPVRRMIRFTLAKGRSVEKAAERHWPFAAYGVLTLATAGYVIAQLVTVTR